MALLRQNENSESYFMGWYGSCETDCTTLSLTLPFIRDKLFKVYQIDANNTGYASFDATLPSQFDSVLQFFTTLDCGKMYIIILKPGNGSIDLPQFTVTKISSPDTGRIVADCKVNLTQTPTPTVTPTKTPRPTPTPTATPKPTATPTQTPRANNPSLCAGYPHTVLMTGQEIVDNQISFTIFPADSRICHWGAAGGPPDLSLVRIAGSTQIIGKIVTNGTINNPTIKYISPDRRIYQGSFKNGGIYTDLFLT
jgi:hypothetical protein